MQDWAAAQGIGTVFTPAGGPPPPFGLPARAVASALVARSLAEAEGTVGSGLGATWDGDQGILTLISRPAGDRFAAIVRSVEELIAALAEARRRGVAAAELEVPGDSRAHATTAAPAAAVPDPSLAPRLTGRSVAPGEGLDVDLVLAGRGVIRSRAVTDLHAFADRVGIGVVNAYTAKGVFRWDSPHHFGTGCLQERDLALAGVQPGGTVLAVGVDADECAPALLAAAGVPTGGFVTMPPEELTTAPVRSTAAGSLEPPAMFRILWDIAQPLYKLTGAPLNPARAAADIAEVLPDGGAVSVQPGMAGLWIGRTLPTRQLGSALVPAAGRPGCAVAGALLGALYGRRRVAIVPDGLDETSEQLLEWARSAALNVTVEVWRPDARPRDAEQHREALAAALTGPGVSVLEVAVDLSITRSLIEAAGELVAW